MGAQGARTKTVIMGAAGRDFHNFNLAYRDDPTSEIVAFTATQIPGIAGRRYPASLSGPLYSAGIPIESEERLEELCRRHAVERVVFAYSDISHAAVMHLASRVLAVGADFLMLGPLQTMIRSRRPVIAVSAIRTGCGKSQTARWLSAYLRDRGLRIGVLRHPMPYGDLDRQRVQRFACLADIDAADCTIEEREEYEPHVVAGNLVFAGVDYAAIVAMAEAESDLLLWDGGNNDFPFLRPDLHIVMVDALRPGQVTTHHPGEAVLRMADVVVVNKVDAAPVKQVDAVIDEVRAVNGSAELVRAASPVRIDDPAAVRGKSVLVIEDGPTITHGGMPYGAGYVALRDLGDVDIVDPRESATPEIATVFAAYPHIGKVLPAMGYGPRQRDALRQTIEDSRAEVVVSATPVDFAKLILTGKPVVRVRYEYADAGEPTLGQVVAAFLDRESRI